MNVATGGKQTKIQNKLRTLSRCLLRRKTCKYFLVIDILLLTITAITAYAAIEYYLVYSTEVAHMEEEDLLLSYRIGLKQNISLYCPYGGFTQANTENCADFCDERAVMHRERRLLDTGDLPQFAYIKEMCPPMVDLIPCYSGIKCIDAAEVPALECGFTAGRTVTSITLLNETLAVFKVPNVSRKIFMVNEIMIQCPTCKAYMPADGSRCHKKIREEHSGFPAYRICPSKEMLNVSRCPAL
ncbi:unnamed protein product [Bursaphelenchus xylophilus]|uniref:(pine wood nematode) hypothetical protein n=1 Tax=Bursaphelenchus xylophilus TaxID=6326 RepID=A0A1I7SRG8_BURXY|nr:unnamed protein product [Bursaphelenchus xylophilus]CAG9102420.1 unnamed protein product [Bursaphelenchus xylophilus]